MGRRLGRILDFLGRRRAGLFGKGKAEVFRGVDQSLFGGIRGRPGGDLVGRPLDRIGLGDIGLCLHIHRRLGGYAGDGLDGRDGHIEFELCQGFRRRTGDRHGTLGTGYGGVGIRVGADSGKRFGQLRLGDAFQVGDHALGIRCRRGGLIGQSAGGGGVGLDAVGGVLEQGQDLIGEVIGGLGIRQQLFLQNGVGRQNNRAWIGRRVGRGGG